MTAQQIAQGTGAAAAEADHATFLRRVIRADGLFSGLSGLLLIAAAGPLAAFLGLSAPWVLAAIGVMLLLYSADLWYIAAQRPISHRLTIAAIVADLAWVLASWAIILTGRPALTTPGAWAVAIVSDVVILFAVLKYVGLRRK
ncbi:MAG: hypothetical protein Kow0031_12990 [Anaerolineae bacterium]